MEFFERPQFKPDDNPQETAPAPQPVQAGIGNGWVILTMLFIAIIALGIYLGEGDECKTFMGIEDRDCVRDRAIDRMMASV